MVLLFGFCVSLYYGKVLMGKLVKSTGSCAWSQVHQQLSSQCGSHGGDVPLRMLTPGTFGPSSEAGCQYLDSY